MLSLGIAGAEGRQLKVWYGKGCVRCRGTGYTRRTGLYEVMPVTPRIARLINDRSPAVEIKKEALNDGMLTLREYGIKKLGRGMTTYEEVLALTEEAKIY